MSTATRLLIDAALVAGFGFQHSALATLKTKAIIKRRFTISALEWRSVESLCNVVYILAAGCVWQSTPDLVLWKTAGITRLALAAITALSWLWYWELHLFEYDCGLAFGSTTLVSRVFRQPIPRLIPWKCGTRRWIRFPVHTAFFGMFLFLPTMTADLFVLGMVLNAYNIVGSIFYDKRLIASVGEPYLMYVDRTGLMLPPVYRCPAGASDLEMESPGHWRRPLYHWPGVAAGILVTFLYWACLRIGTYDASTAFQAALCALLASVIVGLVVGVCCRPSSRDWGQRQCDLSTSVALAAALGVIGWVVASFVEQGEVPSLAYLLPLWFIVQYVGHVVAAITQVRIHRVPTAADLVESKPRATERVSHVEVTTI